MTNEEGQEYYNETMPMPRQATDRELLEEAMKALKPFDNEASNFNHPYDGTLYIATMDDKHKGSLAAFTLGDLLKARRVREKLKAALEPDKDEP